MESIPICGMTLYYDSEEREALDEIVIACERSVQTIKASWGLEVPQDCRVFFTDHMATMRFPRSSSPNTNPAGIDDAIMVFGI